jgi:hypothetical protein
VSDFGQPRALLFKIDADLPFTGEPKIGVDQQRRSSVRGKWGE